MTDEEMAEEWVTANTGLNPREPLGKIAVRTYLAGLKAGKDMAEADLAIVAYMQGAERYKPEWHKVADGDLPKEGTEVLNDDGVVVVLLKGHWRYVYGGEWEDDACLDHWCEIPKYTEE